MNIASTFKNKATKIAVTAAAALVLSTGVAAAKCWITDSDKQGLFGGDKYYSRSYQGNSAKTIWDKYCKKFIQDTVSKKEIANGNFGMDCHGRIQCRVRGSIAGGRVQPPSVATFSR